MPRRWCWWSSSFAAKSVGELIEMAKAKPGAINFGSGGVGTTPHMAAELFLFTTGVRMTHVAYRGEAPAIADVVAGQLPLLFANVSVVTGQVKAGTLRALAVTSPKRAPGLPDVMKRPRNRPGAGHGCLPRLRPRIRPISSAKPSRSWIDSTCCCTRICPRIGSSRWRSRF